jgi:hypothetical protein
LLKDLRDWLKSKTPKEIIDKYWCYVEPVCDVVMDEVYKEAIGKTDASSIVEQILARGIVNFHDRFLKHEGVEPTEKQIDAVKTELNAAIGRVFEGKMPTVDAIKAQQAK